MQKSIEFHNCYHNTKGILIKQLSFDPHDLFYSSFKYENVTNIYLFSPENPTQAPAEALEMIGNKMTNLENLEIRFTTKTESYIFYTPLLKSFRAHQNLTKLELRVWKDGSRDDWPQTLRYIIQ